MLSGKGFSQVINVAGGIKAWNNPVAVGGETMGIEVFDGIDSPEATLKIAYSLEQGLRDFYLSMKETVTDKAVIALFDKLSEIEILHQQSVFEQYLELTGETLTRESFEAGVEKTALEGGLTTGEYLDLFKPDLENPSEVVSLAMSIEGQAMDMYMRVADRAGEGKSRDALLKIAREEQMHMKQLGSLMATL